MMKSASFENDTITARSTAPGEGAIAVIRLSGNLSLRLMRQCIKTDHENVKINYMSHGYFMDKDIIVDEIMFTHFKAPHSYTGEDSLEIYCHGSPAIVMHILETLCRNGVRMAEPGEFTKRAYLNGKMDLARAEAVCDLIRSRTDKAARIALRQLEGGIGDKIRGVKHNIFLIGAEIEARLDFPEEELGKESRSEILKSFDKIINELRSMRDQGQKARLFSQGAKVALLGRPNTGKSSLFNALLKMERAIVTPHPGTTRDAIESTVDLKGCPLTYVDTAGVRESGDEVERMGIDRARNEGRLADLRILVLDRSEPLSEEDHVIIQSLEDKQYILALNKSDLAPAMKESEWNPVSESAFRSVKVSAITDLGIMELENAVGDYLLSHAEGGEDALITGERRLALLKKATDALFEARNGFSTGIHEELVMVDMRQGLLFLSQILGDEIGDEVLDIIFSRFCIGK